MVEFQFKGITFVVKRSQTGNIVYKDKAHLGGMWSDANKSIANKSLHRAFRKSLKEASNFK